MENNFVPAGITFTLCLHWYYYSMCIILIHLLYLHCLISTYLQMGTIKFKLINFQLRVGQKQWHKLREFMTITHVTIICWVHMLVNLCQTSITTWLRWKLTMSLNLCFVVNRNQYNIYTTYKRLNNVNTEIHCILTLTSRCRQELIDFTFEP